MSKKTKVRHREPTDSTKKYILAACGNQCAFPACTRIIAERSHRVLVGDIAHIKARCEGGPRFDPNQSEEDNRSPSNLIALCGEHHVIIDKREDIYPVEKVVAMKSDHEAAVENSADRSWICHPNSIIGPIGGSGPEEINWWRDRTGRPRVYSDRQLTIVRRMMQLYLALDKLSGLQEAVVNNPEATAKSFLQSDLTLQTGECAPIAHLVGLMGEIPDITFGEFAKYLVEGNDATSLIVDRAEEFEKQVQATEAVRIDSNDTCSDDS